MGRASSTNEKGNAYRLMVGKLDVMSKLEETTTTITTTTTTPSHLPTISFNIIFPRTLFSS
jgi:hypothetical protein